MSDYRTLQRTKPKQRWCPPFPALNFPDRTRQADTVRVDLTSFSPRSTCCTSERRRGRSLINMIHVSNIHNSTTSLQLISAPESAELRDQGGPFMAYVKEFLGNGSSNGLYSVLLARKLAGVFRQSYNPFTSQPNLKHLCVGGDWQ